MEVRNNECALCHVSTTKTATIKLVPLAFSNSHDKNYISYWPVYNIIWSPRFSSKARIVYVLYVPDYFKTHALRNPFVTEFLK